MTILHQQHVEGEKVMEIARTILAQGQKSRWIVFFAEA